MVDEEDEEEEILIESDVRVFESVEQEDSEFDGEAERGRRLS